MKAKGKISKDNLGLWRVVVAFGVTERDAKGNLKFPRHKDCAYVSGAVETKELPRVIAYVQNYLKTDIVFEG
jgi:hypothetical protein